MKPLIITESTDKITALKKLSTWLLEELNAVRTKFGAMAVTGAKGEDIAAHENEHATKTVTDLHAAVDGSDAEFQDHLETLKPNAPKVGVVLEPEGGSEAMSASPVHPEDANLNPELKVLPEGQDGIPIQTGSQTSQATSPTLTGTGAPDQTGLLLGPVMRAKMLVTKVTTNKDAAGNITSESYDMTCVQGDKVQNGYPPDGTDEDNSFSKWSPSGGFGISCNNPELFGKIKEGEKYYLDFTLANPVPQVVAAEPAPDSSSSSSSSASSDSSYPAINA